MKMERKHIQRTEVDNRILEKARKLLRRVRDKLVPEQNPPEYDPRETARQKAAEFARYLSEHRNRQTADKSFINEEVVDFGNIVRPLPAALRFEVNLNPEVKSYQLRKYTFLILVMENNQHFLFHPVNFELSVEDDGFIFHLDEGNEDIELIDMTEAFGDELKVYDFGRYYWARLTSEDADDIDDTRKVDLISAGLSQKKEAKERQEELLGFPAWQT